MTYQETVQYLFNATPVFEHVGASAYKPGLGNSITLDNHFGNPHKYYRTIHIAGTNGKGSCSHSIAAILQAAGYKVGLYTSPHLIDFRERIRVNGKPISQQRVIDFVDKERAFFEPLHPSFFELTTALAFLYFKEQEVDVAVIEVGLGGRLDCTNIIMPETSIITNISFDHTQFLGNTLSEIASEKAGIIKPNIPVVIGEDVPETRLIFEEKAKESKSPILFSGDNRIVTHSEPNITKGGRNFTTTKFGDLYCDLSGDYQDKNINTVLSAVSLLKGRFYITKDCVINGLGNVCKTTGLRGRWEKINESPLVICDTGHNAGGWDFLARQIKDQKCNTLRMVFGMVDDKDINAVLSLLPRNATYYWTQASSKRAISSATVAKLGKEHGLNGTDCNSVSNAYQQALSEAEPDDFIFVGGSSYIVADLLSLKVI